jgi:hypothetical protein
MADSWGKFHHIAVAAGFCMQRHISWDLPQHTDISDVYSVSACKFFEIGGLAFIRFNGILYGFTVGRPRTSYSRMFCNGLCKALFA